MNEGRNAILVHLLWNTILNHAQTTISALDCPYVQVLKEIVCRNPTQFCRGLWIDLMFPAIEFMVLLVYDIACCYDEIAVSTKVDIVQFQSDNLDTNVNPPPSLCCDPIFYSVNDTSARNPCSDLTGACRAHFLQRAWGSTLGEPFGGEEAAASVDTELCSEASSRSSSSSTLAEGESKTGDHQFKFLCYR